MATKKEQKEPQYYGGILYESEEEKMVIMWLLELHELGYIERVERAGSYILAAPVIREYKEEKVLKTKNKIVDKKETVLQGHVYTAEYKITWNQKAFDVGIIGYLLTENKKAILHYTHIGAGLQTWVEVKPAWDQNNMTRLFKINQKWVYDKYGIYINLLYPHKLMEDTFTPKAYLKTSTGKDRKVNWDIKSAEEWLGRL